MSHHLYTVCHVYIRSSFIECLIILAALFNSKEPICECKTIEVKCVTAAT